MTTSGFGGATGERDAVSAETTTNLLLSFPSLDDRERHTCRDLLSVDGPDNRAVILVALSETPDHRIDRWRETVGRLPDRLHVITSTDTTRSATEAAESTGVATDVSVDTVSSPRDLTGIGIAISNYLESIDDHPGDIAVCFDSLSTLLNHVDSQQVFKFLHVLTAQLRSVDAAAHFHVDPTAHDAQAVRAITSLFDAMITDDGEGGIEVRSR